PDEEWVELVHCLLVSIVPRGGSVFLRNKLKDQPGFNFPLLSDANHRVIDRYGLLNEQSQRGWPQPATYVIDREGKVRWKFVEVDYKVRPSNEDVLAQLKKVETVIK